MVTPSRRSTTDIVVIILTSMVAVSMIIATVGIIVGKILRPETDTKVAVELLGNVITTVVGALVGFIGGRAAGRIEGANGRLDNSLMDG